jgi:hypothetical protein
LKSGGKIPPEAHHFSFIQGHNPGWEFSIRVVIILPLEVGSVGVVIVADKILQQFDNLWKKFGAIKAYLIFIKGHNGFL